MSAVVRGVRSRLAVDGIKGAPGECCGSVLEWWDAEAVTRF